MKKKIPMQYFFQWDIYHEWHERFQEDTKDSNDDELSIVRYDN